MYKVAFMTSVVLLGGCAASQDQSTLRASTLESQPPSGQSTAPVVVIESAPLEDAVALAEPTPYVETVQYVDAVPYAEPVEYVEPVAYADPVQYAEPVEPILYVQPEPTIAPTPYVEPVAVVDATPVYSEPTTVAVDGYSEAAIVSAEPPPGEFYREGAEHLREGDAGLAIKKLNRALHYEGPTAKIHMALGAAYDMLRRPGLAREHFVEAVRLAPASRTARLNLARFLSRHGYEEAADFQYSMIDRQAAAVVQ